MEYVGHAFLIFPLVMGIILMILTMLDFEIFMPRRVEKKINRMKLKMLVERLIKEDRSKQFRKAR